jgi:hypothetical protein
MQPKTKHLLKKIGLAVAIYVVIYLLLFGLLLLFFGSTCPSASLTQTETHTKLLQWCKDATGNLVNAYITPARSVLFDFLEDWGMFVNFFLSGGLTYLIKRRFKSYSEIT